MLQDGFGLGVHKYRNELPFCLGVQQGENTNTWWAEGSEKYRE